MKNNLLVFVKEGLNGLLNLAYPPACGICNKKLSTAREENFSICSDCLAKIKKNLPPYCKKCGCSLRGATDLVETCSECSKRKFYYERSWSCTLYEGVIKEAIHLLKYSKKFYLSNLFYNLLIQFVKDNPEILREMDAVLAVPLHSVRFREREFNQAHLLATAVIKEFNINPAPLKRCGIKDLSHCLKRTVSTKPQSELDKKERLNNVRGVFEAVESQLIYGKNLLLVDDLFTTGATLNECAKVLKKADAGKIHCLTFARGV